MRETKNPVSDAARTCAVQVLTMTALAVALPIVPAAPSVIGFALWCLVGLAVFTAASRVLEHRNPDWRGLLGGGLRPDYELVAFPVAFIAAILVMYAVPVSEPRLLMLLGFYAAGVAGSVTIAIGKVWSNRTRQ